MKKVCELIVIGSQRKAIVDAEFAYLSKYRWRISCNNKYPFRKVHGKRKFLHHEVIGPSRWPLKHADHINRDVFDNRKANLRWLTRAQSRQNTPAHRNNVTGLRGVHKVRNRYIARAGLNHKLYHLGTFDNPVEAYNVARAWRMENMSFANN